MNHKVAAAYLDDGSHGYLRVPRAVIDFLGIAEKISSSSYQKDGVVYLEEDADAAIFLKTMLANGFEVDVQRWLKPNVDIKKLPRYNGLT